MRYANWVAPAALLALAACAVGREPPNVSQTNQYRADPPEVVACQVAGQSATTSGQMRKEADCVIRARQTAHDRIVQEVAPLYADLVIQDLHASAARGSKEVMIFDSEFPRQSPTSPTLLAGLEWMRVYDMRCDPGFQQAVVAEIRDNRKFPVRTQTGEAGYWLGAGCFSNAWYYVQAR